MKTTKTDKNIYVSGITDFNLGQTIECGQCFHYEKVSDTEYLLSAKGRFLHVAQENDRIIFYDTDEAELKDVWINYFDLDRDYGVIKKELRQRDKRLNDAMNVMWGIHILNQDFFETMISFIISQNKQIPHIMKIVSELSMRYGKQIHVPGASGVHYCFPTPEALLNAGEAGLRECKTGFRAPYIINACERYVDGTLDERRLREMSYDEAVNTLMQVRGIGEKVANCIALFGLGKRNAFPVDVWIKRTMECIYIGHEADKKYISGLAESLFGEYGGYAQQYLFYYGKQMKLGK